MKVLLDTHAFLWFIIETLISRGIADNDFAILAIEPKHVAILTNLPFHHKDPFDRLLIAQALVEQIPIVSIDPQIDKYGVQRIW